MSFWSKGMCSSSDVCLAGCTAEHLPPSHPDPPPSNLGGFYTSHKDGKNIKGLIHRIENTASGLSCSVPVEYNLSTGSTRTPLSPVFSSHYDWSLNSGRQAKRARVENIIKGITCTDVAPNQHEETGCVREGEERVEVSALHQRHVEASGTESLSESHRYLREVRTKFSPICEDEKFPRWSVSSEASTDEVLSKSCSESESSSGKIHQEWKKATPGHLGSKPDRAKLMADILKYELTRAVSRSVDSIFKSMPLVQTPTEMENSETTLPPHLAECMEDKLRCGTAEVLLPDVQTEALSLVVQKPELERPRNFILQSTSAAPLTPKSPIFFSSEPEQASKQDNITHHRRHSFKCLPGGCSEGGEPRLDTYWNLVKVKSKVTSRCVRSPHTHTVPVDQVILESLQLPHVKLEPDCFEKNNLYMLNECLTTNHLKKAKLMFFYTRYPSSVVLRMCFHDVQFTRCITSQLIKWFSNFREFYYIQMEKFARSALLEGAPDVRDLTVSRESELFRSLNMHYNKANDFQVPDRFLEVAEVTLREFYIAISMGKDRDPSWKKTIYKVICKLDSDVPPEFKSHHFG
ncbi:prospero homeobox protein 1-like isoform X2 [Poecilia formosa]|uniref:prospero homeobox protein 1-like isoform X2 n=1 Tax=Poecilia formosa TaxID=48698 RepID=UPI00044436D7|nr:PREDICTED: prospero homeobox protein 1-like isoform X2 [Poecilia formosa]